MAVSHCERLAEIVACLDVFISSEWETRKEMLPQSVFERDQRFIQIARNAAESCSAEQLKGMLEEMRGLSHYFGSYCADVRRLDELIDEIFHQVREAIVDARSAPRSCE